MNGDLISRAAALDMRRRMVEYDESGCGLTMAAVAVEDIETLPAVDAVEVVRCKDCVYRENGLKCPMSHLAWLDGLIGMDCLRIDKTTDNGFCYKGAKMDKED